MAGWLCGYRLEWVDGGGWLCGYRLEWVDGGWLCGYRLEWEAGGGCVVIGWSGWMGGVVWL